MATRPRRPAPILARRASPTMLDVPRTGEGWDRCRPSCDKAADEGASRMEAAPANRTVSSSGARGGGRRPEEHGTRGRAQFSRGRVWCWAMALRWSGGRGTRWRTRRRGGSGKLTGGQEGNRDQASRVEAGGPSGDAEALSGPGPGKPAVAFLGAFPASAAAKREASGILLARFAPAQAPHLTARRRLGALQVLEAFAWRCGNWKALTWRLPAAMGALSRRPSSSRLPLLSWAAPWSRYPGTR